MNVLGFGLQRQDSSPSQSTGISHQEVTSFASLSGSDDNDGRRVDGYLKSSFYLRTSEKVLPDQKLDYGQSARYAPFPFEDPYLGMMATYRSHLIVHPQVTGTGQAARVPLPLDIFGNEPIYVNAKQYKAILRRRQTRAKLEAQCKLVKERKPYLHESRHRHAMKRIRGAGGRFLNTKQLQQQQQCQTQRQSPLLHQPKQCQLSRSFSPVADPGKFSDSVMLQLGGEWNPSNSSALKSDICDMGTSRGDSGYDMFTISSKHDLFSLENSQRFPEFRGSNGAHKVHAIL